MKILHLSDLHFHRPWFDWVRERAPDYDAVAIAGDLLGPESLANPRKQVRWVQSWIATFPRPLLLCSGNWDERDIDLPEDLEGWLGALSYPHVKTDGQTTQIGEWTIECVPWLQQPTLGGGRQLALVHCPPEGCATSIDAESGRDFGDFNLAENLRVGICAPQIVLGGHVHNPVHWAARCGSTWSINPGVGQGIDHRMPAAVAVDLDNGCATRLLGGKSTARVDLSP